MERDKQPLNRFQQCTFGEINIAVVIMRNALLNDWWYTDVLNAAHDSCIIIYYWEVAKWFNATGFDPVMLMLS